MVVSLLAVKVGRRWRRHCNSRIAGGKGCYRPVPVRRRATYPANLRLLWSQSCPNRFMSAGSLMPDRNLSVEKYGAIPAANRRHTHADALCAGVSFAYLMKLPVIARQP